MATKIAVLDLSQQQYVAVLIEFLDRHLNDGFTLLACESAATATHAYVVYTLYKPDAKDESEVDAS